MKRKRKKKYDNIERKWVPSNKFDDEPKSRQDYLNVILKEENGSSCSSLTRLLVVGGPSKGGLKYYTSPQRCIAIDSLDRRRDDQNHVKRK